MSLSPRSGTTQNASEMLMLGLSKVLFENEMKLTEIKPINFLQLHRKY